MASPRCQVSPRAASLAALRSAATKADPPACRPQVGARPRETKNLGPVAANDWPQRRLHFTRAGLAATGCHLLWLFKGPVVPERGSRAS